MRTAGALAILLLVPACKAQDSGPSDRPTANVPLPQATEMSPKPVGNAGQNIPSVREAQANACRSQDGAPVTHTFRVIGTEPFWGAEIDGRCITYKTPEDQAGTRVWTKVRASAQATVWDGALRGNQFQLTVKPKADCSDGMSDKVYPFEAVLRVEGETRSGCAEGG